MALNVQASNAVSRASSQLACWKCKAAASSTTSALKDALTLGLDQSWNTQLFEIWASKASQEFRPAHLSNYVGCIPGNLVSSTRVKISNPAVGSFSAVACDTASARQRRHVM